MWLQSATRRIGFRTAYLTTGNDTDAAWVSKNTGGNGNAIPANSEFTSDLLSLVIGGYFDRQIVGV